MPKYMTQFTYSAKSMEGMVKNPQNRQSAAAKVFGAAGGKIEAMYFCFGEYDGIVIADFPSNVAAASAIMAVGASGGFSSVKTTVLIPMNDTVEAMRGAKKIAGEYMAPAG